MDSTMSSSVGARMTSPFFGRDLSTTNIWAPGAWRYLRDGRYVAAAITDSSFSNKENKYYVGIYDGRNGTEITRLAVSGTDGVAISPDGRILAAAHLVYGKRGVVPTVIIYDVATGSKLAIVEHMNRYS